MKNGKGQKREKGLRIIRKWSPSEMPGYVESVETLSRGMKRKWITKFHDTDSSLWRAGIPWKICGFCTGNHVPRSRRKETYKAGAVCGESRTHGPNGGDGETDRRIPRSVPTHEAEYHSAGDLPLQCTIPEDQSTGRARR